MTCRCWISSPYGATRPGWQRRQPDDIDGGLIGALSPGHVRKPWARGVGIHQARADSVDQQIAPLGLPAQLPRQHLHRRDLADL